jgi:DNA (cytosine-5)-methyltransferase 1
MLYATVCSGIEAPTVAWHPLGWRAAWYSEIEKFCCRLLAQKYPDTPNLGDMTKIGEADARDHGPIDLLMGGTPCQSFSVAGLRQGLDDPRGNLALRFCQLAGVLKPQWVVWENVPGVLSSGGGRDFGSFLGGLVQLGYGCFYRVLDAQHVRVQSHPRAVPQRRRRVFVVGYLGDWRRAAAVLLERQSMSGNPPPRREAGKGTAVSVIKGAAIGREPHNGPQYGDYLDDGSCYTLQTNERHAVTHSLRADGFDASEDGTGRGIPLISIERERERERERESNTTSLWIIVGWRALRWRTQWSGCIQWTNHPGA